MNKLIRYATHLAITDYSLGDCKPLEYTLSYKENWTTHPIGMVYDEQRKELLIFGGIEDSLIQYKTGLGVKEDHHYDIPKNISIRLRNMPRDRLQSEMIQFLIGGGEYQYNNNCPQLACNADTGEGKTFCAIAMITYMRVKTIVILNRINILNQWIDEITTFTDIDPQRIAKLTTEMMIEVYEGKDISDKYDIYVVGHRTLANAAKILTWDAIGEVFQKLGIGLKLYDEAHREFRNTTFIDCYTNTAKTIYLTATLKVAGRKANYIFQKLFKGMPRFNQRKLGFTESKKHITMIAMFYNSQPSVEDKCKCKTVRGFNAKAHSLYQISNDPFFFDVIDSLVEKMAIKNGFRSIIYVSRIMACDTITARLKKKYPDVDIASYHSEIQKAEKERILNESHIIVSTNQSLGLGETIPNLQWVCNCEAFSTDTIGQQASGRLRRFKDGRKCFYTELIDIGFKSIRNQWNARRKLYSNIFHEVITIDLNQKNII